MWTDQQLEQYREQGFLFQRDLLSRSEIDELCASAEVMMRDQDNPPEVEVQTDLKYVYQWAIGDDVKLDDIWYPRLHRGGRSGRRDFYGPASGV